MFVAIGYSQRGGSILKQLNVSVWNNEECAQMKEVGRDRINTLLCVEDPCCDSKELCDLCPVKF